MSYWPGQEYVVAWVIRESGRIVWRTHFRQRLMIGLLALEICLGVLNVALLRTQWMNLPMVVIVGLLFGVVWAGRADVRRARRLKKRAEEL